MKLIRGDGEFRRKLVAACRKVSRRATVAWRKRTILRDIRTQGNFGPLRILGAAGEMVTLRAKVARRKGTFAGENQTRDKAGRKASRQPVGLKRWMRPADRIGIKYPGGRGPRDLRKESTTTNGIGAWTSGQQLLLGSRGAQKEARYELVSVDIATAMMWSIQDWTLWRGRPPPKRLKREPHA
jgi:hypothetical protein